MQVIGCCIIVAVQTLMVLWRLSFVIAQPGFLSIDCGGKTNRRDPATNITWVTDDNYLLSSGLKVEINDSASPFYLQSARVFAKPNNKCCYRLPLTPNVPHLLRLWFNSGTFNGLQQIPRFDFSIETVDMLFLRELRFQDDPLIPRAERVLLSSGEEVYFCLIRSTEEDNLFVSAIELRTLEKGMYDVLKPGQILRTLARYDIGAESTARYPKDRFDRLWNPLSIEGAENVSSMEPISTKNTINFPPSAVMQTAAVTKNDSMYFSLPQYPIPQTIKSFLLLLYFAEIQQLNGSESRSFDVLINNEISLANISLRRDFSAIANIILRRDFSAREVAFPSETPQLSFTLQRDSSSTRGPIINAFEHYQVLPTQTATSSVDAQALAAVKQRFNIKNWISDPCFVLPWEGIQCSNISSTIRVSEINLSGRNLTGSIPPNLAKLTELVHFSFDFNGLPFICIVDRSLLLHTPTVSSNDSAAAAAFGALFILKSALKKSVQKPRSTWFSSVAPLYLRPITPSCCCCVNHFETGRISEQLRFPAARFWCLLIWLRAGSNALTDQTAVLLSCWLSQLRSAFTASLLTAASSLHGFC